MKGEMRWKEKEQEREKNKVREIDEMDVETEQEERNSEIFPDFGRMCGKSVKEKPFISRQLQAARRAGFLARCYLSFF